LSDLPEGKLFPGEYRIPAPFPDVCWTNGDEDTASASACQSFAQPRDSIRYRIGPGPQKFVIVSAYYQYHKRSLLSLTTEKDVCTVVEVHDDSYAVRRLPTSSVESTATGLGDSSAGVRLAAINVLEDFGKSDPKVKGMLEHFLETEKDERVRARAEAVVKALGEKGGT
jgi:hypothetical protein